jgi:hypothetical protein
LRDEARFFFGCGGGFIIESLRLALERLGQLHQQEDTDQHDDHSELLGIHGWTISCARSDGLGVFLCGFCQRRLAR